MSRIDDWAYEVNAAAEPWNDAEGVERVACAARRASRPRSSRPRFCRLAETTRDCPLGHDWQLIDGTYRAVITYGHTRA